MQNQVRKMQFINDNLRPSEAKDVVSLVIDSSIHFYKLHHLTNLEKDHSIDKILLDAKMLALDEQKQELKQMIDEAFEGDNLVSITGTLELKLIKNTVENSEYK